MKTLYTFLSVLFCFSVESINAQAPQAIPYQAVARDSAGNFIANQNIALRFSIHDSSAGGTMIYQETQTAATNMLGLFSVNIGQGTPLIGALGWINWGNGTKFMQVEFDPSGGINYINMGTQQMMSVPYALFSGNGSLWNSSGSNIFNTNSGMVGIGTTTPSGILNIASVINKDELVVGENLWNVNDASNRIQLGNSSNSSFIRAGQADSSFVSMGWVYNAIPANSYANIGVSFGAHPLLLQRDGGNVGIGTGTTTLPVNKLTVTGAKGNPLIPGSTTNGIMRIGVASNEGIDFGKMGSVPFTAWIQAGFNSTEADPLSLQPIGGNVGIGTTNPSSKLNVEAVGSASEVLRISNDKDATKDSVMVLTSSGNVGIGTISPVTTLDVRDTSASITVGRVSNTAGALYLGNPSHGFQRGFPTYGNDNNVGLFTTSANLYLSTNGKSIGEFILSNAGNVGIGISSPSTKLDINSTAAFNTTTPGTSFYNLHLSSPQSATNDQATGITFGTANNLNPQAGIYVQNSTVYGTKMYFGTTNSYATGSQTRMTIDNIGNVGIGTITPSSKLNVEAVGSASEVFRISNDKDATKDSVMVLTSAGNVGIGTITPASKLDVAGKTKTTTFQMTTGGAAGNVLASDASGNATWTPSSSLTITETDPQVSSTTTNQVSKWNGTTLVDGGITDDGTNIGIGTSLPAFKFDLSHTANAKSGTNVDVSELGMKIGNANETIGNAVGMGFGKSADPTNIGAAIIFERSSSQSIGHMHFATKNTSVAGGDIPIRMTIDSIGNVGIGCTIPKYKLHVIGDIASSATVRTTSLLSTGAILSCSDIRFKKQITPLQNSLENILQLQGVNYFWKTNEFPDRYFNETKQIGLIAQEVEKIFPELVITDYDGYKSVDYSKLTPILIEAVKELKAENENMKAENSSVKRSLDEMRTQTQQKFNALEAKINLITNAAIAVRDE